MGKELTLPKNIRQIGDIQGKEKIFLEDYVMTYIKKKEKQEKDGYLGIFLGERQEKEEAVYVFVRGILEVPAEMMNSQEAEEKHATAAKEDSSDQKTRTENWKEKMERDYQEYFPDWTVQGCCVIGVYPTERMRLLSESLPEAGGLIYHLQEQEETIYRVENGRYRQIKGYFVFYEQNRKMQEYLSAVFSHDSVEKEGSQDNAIRSFRKKVKEKGLQKNTSFLKLASSFFVVTVLVIGAIVVNRIDEIQDVRNAAGTGDTTVENEIMYVEDSITGDSGISVAAGTSETGNVTSSSGAEAVGFPTSAEEEGVSVSSSQVGISDLTGTAGLLDSAADVSNVIDSELTQELAGSNAFWSDVSLEDAAVSSDMSAQIGTQNAVSTEQTGVQSAVSSDTSEQTGMQDIVNADMSVQTGAQNMAGSDQNGDQDTAESAQTEAAQEAAAIRQMQAAYVIKEGDTLADICSRYYGSLDRLTDICEVNEITDANMIMPGQKIVLP